MEESRDTAEMRKMRKEQERERRRLRDRERRQSMSQEEREKHLARRRRNYQLRRQKAERARLDSQIQLISEGEMLINNPELLVASSPDSGMHFDGAMVPFGFDQGQDALHTECNKVESLDISLHDLAKLRGRLRLNRLKHLARTLNRSSAQASIETLKITADIMAKSNGNNRCALSSSLRLSHFKRLARSFSSSTKENSGQGMD